MIGTEIVNIDNEMDQLVSAFNNDDAEALMKMTGQSEGTKKTGLPRLNINYQDESEDGHALPRGSWKIMLDGEFLYAKQPQLRPILRTYEWSLWDQDEGTFAAKSVQKPSLSGSFPDSVGGDKCGRLPKEQEEVLGEDHPDVMRSRAAICNQVIYGIISGDFTKADGTEVTVDRQPVVAYFKKSGFMPISNFINSLSKQKKVMQRCVIDLGTDRKKMGSVTYWVPVPTLSGEVDVTDEDKELMTMFVESVKVHNEAVMSQHREAAKLIMSDDDSDLAADFEDASAA